MEYRLDILRQRITRRYIPEDSTLHILNLTETVWNLHLEL
jgi:hypothetical protein